MKVKEFTLVGAPDLRSFTKQSKSEIADSEYKIVSQLKDLLVLIEINLERNSRNDNETFTFVASGDKVIFVEVSNLANPFSGFPNSAIIDDEVIVVCNYYLHPGFVKFAKKHFKKLRGLVCPHVLDKSKEELLEIYPNMFIYTDNIISQKRDNPTLRTIMSLNEDKLLQLYKNGGLMANVNVRRLAYDNIIDD